MRHRMSFVIRFTLPLLFAFLFLPLRAQTSLRDHPQPQPSLPDAPSSSGPPSPGPAPQVSAGSAPAGQRVDDAWPRKATRGDETFSMYQPQLEAWKGDDLQAYAAVAVMSTA